MNQVDPSYMQTLSPENQKWLDEQLKKDMSMKEAKIGSPVYVKDHRCSDGTLWSGWGILTHIPKQNCELRRFTVLACVYGSAASITVKEFYLEEPIRETKRSKFIDDDGYTIAVEYGQIETDRGREWIFGIDAENETFAGETVSFMIKDLDVLIDAIQKVK